MARPTDGTESESNLPQPELNPLLNPVLGQHMGRWAEVYFTSPPEKREEAVLELLRELQSNPTSQPEPAGEYPNEVLPGNPVHEMLESIHVPSLDEELRCPSCGERNAAIQIFCGACGAPIQVGISRAGLRGAEWPVREAAADNGPPEQVPAESPRFEEFSEEQGPSLATPEQPGVYDYPRRPSWSWEEEARQHAKREKKIARRNRISMLAALLVLAGGLIYVSWRNSQAWPGNSHSLPQAVQPVRPAIAQPSPPAASAKSIPAAKSVPSGKSPEPGALQPEAATKSIAPQAAALAPPRAVALAAPAGGGFAGAGIEELTRAQAYLNGTEGKARDSSEAAKWLWKSVAKQNATATLLLSELYLRGDGVTRSCDQGRLLLVAAVRKKAAGAAERLRNLAAFGCE